MAAGRGRRMHGTRARPCNMPFDTSAGGAGRLPSALVCLTGVPALTTRLALAVAMSLGLALPLGRRRHPGCQHRRPAGQPVLRRKPAAAALPAVRQDQGQRLRPGLRCRHGTAAEGSGGDRQQQGQADLRQHHHRPEKSGDVLDRATTVFFSLVGADTNDTRKKLQADYSARFAAHSDAIALNGKLFARIQALYDSRSTLGLTPKACAWSRSTTTTTCAPAPSRPRPTRPS